MIRLSMLIMAFCLTTGLTGGSLGCSNKRPVTASVAEVTVSIAPECLTGPVIKHNCDISGHHCRTATINYKYGCEIIDVGGKR